MRLFLSIHIASIYSASHQTNFNMNIRFFIVKAIFQLRFRIKLLLPMTEGRIQNPVEPLRWSFKSLTIFAKSSILDVRLGSEYASVEYC